MTQSTHVARRRAKAGVACVLAFGTAMALSSCGTVSKLTTSKAISQSIDRVCTQPALRVQFSVGVTASQLQQIAAKSGDSKLTPAEARALSTGSIFFSVQTGHGEALDSRQAATDKDDSADFGLQIGSDIPIEVRYVQQALYARVDAKTLLTDAGQDPAEAGELSNALREANSFVPGLATLAEGGWVEVDASSLQTLGKLFRQYASSLGAGSSSASQSQIRSMATALRKDLVGAIEDNATYQNLGTHSGRTGYGVTVNVHGFLDQFAPDLQKDLNLIPGALGNQASSAIKKAEAKVPANRTVVLHLFVQNNRLQELDLDLNQFARHPMPFPVPLRMALSTPSPIAAPASATTLDLSKLPSLLGGMLGSLGGAAHAAT